MGMITDSALGEILIQHYSSLPFDERDDAHRPWPWIAIFVGLPLVATSGLAVSGFAPQRTAAVGLLAGVGVLGGLLFQVLAWISGRLGTIADAVNADAPSSDEVDLIARLDIARTNIAYAALLSVVFVVELGSVALLSVPPAWASWVSAFLLVHLAATLVLVILRISAIGDTDRVTALTRHARRRSRATRNEGDGPSGS